MLIQKEYTANGVLLKDSHLLRRNYILFATFLMYQGCSRSFASYVITFFIKRGNFHILHSTKSLEFALSKSGITFYVAPSPIRHRNTTLCTRSEKHQVGCWRHQRHLFEQPHRRTESAYSSYISSVWKEPEVRRRYVR